MENKEIKEKLSQEDIEYIHSEEFINKFGDWEKANRLEKLKGANDISLDNALNNAKIDKDEFEVLKQQKLFRTLKNLVVANYASLRNDNEKIEIELPDKNIKANLSVGNIKHILSHQIAVKGQLEAALSIEEIGKNAIYIDSDISDGERPNPNIKNYDYFMSGAVLDGKNYTIKSVVGYDGQGNALYYDQRATEIEKRLYINNQSLITNKGKTDTQPFQDYDKRLIQICQVPQLPYMEFNSATKQWLPTKETIEAVKENRLFVEKVGQEYQMKINDITNKSNIKGNTENRKSIKAIDVWNEINKTIAENPEYKAINFTTLDYLYNKGTDDAAGYDNSFERNLNSLKEISKSDKQLESILKKYKDYKIDFDDKALTVKIAGTHNNNFNKAKQDLLDFIENKKYLRESEINQKQGQLKSQDEIIDRGIEAAAIKERNQQNKLATQIILDQEDKEQMESISSTMKSVTKDFMDLNATPITEERTKKSTENFESKEYWKNQFQYDNAEPFKAIDDYLEKGIRPKNNEFIFKNVPEVLKYSGISKNDIILTTGIINKAKNTHNLSDKEIKNAILSLSTPVAIFDFDKNKSENNTLSIINITDIEAENNKPIAITINLDNQRKGYEQKYLINEIRSIHDRSLIAKNGVNIVEEWAKAGLLRYVDDKKISNLVKEREDSFLLPLTKLDKNNINLSSKIVNSTDYQEIWTFSEFTEQQKAMEKEYQIKINDITNKSNIQGATAMNENEKSAVKKMDEELEKTILREHQEMEELEAEAAVAKAVDESVQNITEENDSETLLEKILDDKEKKEKENILEEENFHNNVFLLNRNDELSNEVESPAITDSVFSANESERSIYDEIPKIFEDLNTHFNESVREKENWDFRYKGIKIGEVSKDGSIKFCENEKLSELNLDLEKIKEQISTTNFAKRENFSFEENCNLGEDKREEKYVKMFEEQQKTELKKEIDSEEMNSKSFAKDFAQKIQSANLEEVNSLFNNARKQNIDMSAISDFRDEKGNNVLHLAAKNPNLTPEMLTVFHKNLGAEKSTELYFCKNNEDKIPIDISRTENFLPDKNVNFEKTFGSKKQFFDVPKPFSAMSIGSSVALEFEKNKNLDKFNVDNAAFNSVMKKSLQDQMTQRKNLIENWDFRNDSEGIAQAFENKGVSFDKKTRSNIISYNFVHFAGGEKKVLDSIKLSENKDGLSILESSNTNLTALVERNFKIEKDKNYRLFRDISNTTAFMNVPGRNEPTPNYKEFPQDYMKQNGYFPPMLVQNARNENGEKSVLVAGKDEFGNPCEYRMNETQVSNIIHNSMNYAAKNGEKVDFLKDKNVVPLSHIDFIKNHDPNADIGTAFRDSLNSFEKQHQTKVFAPFVKEQEFKQKMEQEANLEKAKKLAYEQNQTLGGMER